MLNINVILVGLKENNAISTDSYLLDASLPITCRHLSIRVGEHSGISPLTGK